MKKLRKIFIFKILFISLLLLLFSSKVLATTNFARLVDYSDDFKNWLELSDEDKKKSVLPRAYNVTNMNNTSKNPFLRALRAYHAPRYTLQDVIPANVSIKDQMSTNSCWTFATLSSLETNLAMQDYRKGNPVKIYDYSERHMEYATSKTFLHNVTNPDGYNRTVNDGGNWYYGITYLVNGQGAIIEDEMPFEDNKDIIDISEIKNKTVATQVIDTIDFPNYLLDTANANDIKNNIKQHIQTYGAVYSSTHGALISSSNCYNNATGAKYCNCIYDEQHLTDHAISIIGWDDNFAIDNFATQNRPSSPGAWIVRNSWGARKEYLLSDLKQIFFNSNHDYCIAQNWHTATDIPNSKIEDFGYMIEGDIAYYPIGDNGLMYISYEDFNVAKSLSGIVNSSDKLNYNNIYHYDKYYPVFAYAADYPSIVLGTSFDKKSSDKEYVTQVSLFAPQTYTCKVYINPNGTSKNRADLQEVSLKSGEVETISPGYHTLEFATPIEITGSSFFIAVEARSPANSTTYSVEAPVTASSTYDCITVENGKCFITSSDWSDGNFDTWYDVSTLTKGDTTLRAFTITETEDNSLKNISITTPPTKTTYYVGEDFDPAGMVVTGSFKNNSTSEITDYQIENGTNLKLNQTFVTIKFQNCSTVQNISVTEKAITPPVTDPPDVPKPDEELKVQNSDFSKATSKVIRTESYISSTNSKTNYMLVEVEISQLNRILTNDKVEYYYSLSPNFNEQNIESWTKISENQTASDKLKFEIDSREVSNFSEISSSETLYLYIKEVAVKGGEQRVFFSNAFDLTSEVMDDIKVFVDGVKVNDTSSTPNKDNTSSTPNKDNTTANGKLPQTGISITVSIFIIVALIGGLVFYIRYKRFINKMK